ncbi:MAG: hypothetical protein IID45_10490, partial [Planctomycetes bacterium]|nr:hypothetical protein [Planctomycetota bacterium]
MLKDAFMLPPNNRHSSFVCRGARRPSARWVDAYFVRLVRVARAVVGDAEEARDLVQEAFIANGG